MQVSHKLFTISPRSISTCASCITCYYHSHSDLSDFMTYKKNVCFKNSWLVMNSQNYLPRPSRASPSMLLMQKSSYLHTTYHILAWLNLIYWKMSHMASSLVRGAFEPPVISNQQSLAIMEDFTSIMGHLHTS